MIERWKKVNEWVGRAARAVWQHRVSYAGLACAYSLFCCGWVDKDTVAQITAALYCAMVAQRH